MSWAYRGALAPRRTRAQNEERASGVRLRIEREVVDFVVLRHDGTEHSRWGDMLDASDAMRALGNGACVVDQDGVMLAYRADAVSASSGHTQAQRSVSRWMSERPTLPAPPPEPGSEESLAAMGRCLP